MEPINRCCGKNFTGVFYKQLLIYKMQYVSLERRKGGVYMLKHIRERIVYKLFLIFLICIFIPIVIFSGISYYLSYKNLYNSFVENRIKLNSQIADNVKDNIYTLKSQSLALYNYDSISYILNTPTKDLSEEYIKNYDSVYVNLVSVIQGNQKLDCISMINLDGEVKFYYDKNMAVQNLKNVKYESWFNKTIEANGKAVTLSPHINSYTNSGEVVISVCRILTDPNSDKPIGILKIDQKLETFKENLSNAVENEGEDVIVYSREGVCYYATNKEMGIKQLRAYQGISNYEEDSENNKLVIRSNSSDDEWSVVSIVEKKEVRKQADFIKNINLGLLAFMFIICILIALMFSFGINNPIQKLIESIKRFQNGDMYEQVVINREDEFGQIGKAINNMIVSIRKHIYEEYQMKLLKQQAEFENYQSQISPHFLFNTLNSIKAVVLQGNSKMGSDMIQYLSDHFRYSLTNGRYLVAFSEEIDYLDKYIALQQIRFNDRCRIEKTIEEEVFVNEIPRMVLQPIVENAYKHGVEKTNLKCKITIVAQNVLDEFIIYVSNTGPVMTSEKMEIINRNLQLEKGEYDTLGSKKIGIYNVNARICYHYGKNYGVRFISSKDNLTVIRIVLPNTHSKGMNNGENDENINN